MIEYLKIVYSTCYEHIIYLCAYVSMYKKQKNVLNVNAEIIPI